MDFGVNEHLRETATVKYTLGDGYPWRVTDHKMHWYVVNVETKKAKKIGRVNTAGRGMNYFKRAKEEADKRNDAQTERGYTHGDGQ